MPWKLSTWVVSKVHCIYLSLSLKKWRININQEHYWFNFIDGFLQICFVALRKTLQLAQELSDRAVEAQACYSLGNTYTLLRDYPMAIHYHLRHLAIAQELNDRVGEGRACWSLGNAYSATNNHEKALYYANRHLVISKEVSSSLKPSLFHGFVWSF